MFKTLNCHHFFFINSKMGLLFIVSLQKIRYSIYSAFTVQSYFKQFMGSFTLVSKVSPWKIVYEKNQSASSKYVPLLI